MLGVSIHYGTTCAHLILSKIFSSTVTMKKHGDSRIWEYLMGSQGRQKQEWGARGNNSPFPAGIPGPLPKAWLAGRATMQSHSIRPCFA